MFSKTQTRADVAQEQQIEEAPVSRKKALTVVERFEKFKELLLAAFDGDLSEAWDNAFNKALREKIIPKGKGMIGTGRGLFYGLWGNPPRIGLSFTQGQIADLMGIDQQITVKKAKDWEKKSVPYGKGATAVVVWTDTKASKDEDGKPVVIPGHWTLESYTPAPEVDTILE